MVRSPRTRCSANLSSGGIVRSAQPDDLAHVLRDQPTAEPSPATYEPPGGARPPGGRIASFILNFGALLLLSLYTRRRNPEVQGGDNWAASRATLQRQTRPVLLPRYGARSAGRRRSSEPKHAAQVECRARPRRRGSRCSNHRARPTPQAYTLSTAGSRNGAASGWWGQWASRAGTAS
jgi:hypothetical protein